MIERGRYAVRLSYGCRPLDAGGSLRLVSEGSELVHQVEAPATGRLVESKTVTGYNLVA